MSSSIETSRLPRSEVEATFIKLQEESDRAGVVIYSQPSWELEDSLQVHLAKQTFNTCLERLRNFAPNYVGEEGVEVGIEARYLLRPPHQHNLGQNFLMERLVGEFV